MLIDLCVDYKYSEWSVILSELGYSFVFVCVCERFFFFFFFRTVLRISSNFPKHRLNNGPEKRIRIFLLSLCGARSHISSPKHSFDSNQQQTLLFVRNKQGLMP